MANGRTIDLTVLVYGNWCQTARAYLAYMAACGLRPRKVLHVIAPGPRWQAALLARACGRRAAARLVEWIIMRPYRRPALRRLCEAVQRGFEVQVDYFSPPDYSGAADEYERVIVPDLNSAQMLDVLRRQTSGALLYTCGGRVGGELLALPNLRVLHIHPGIVPHVKGSDGLLWSLATRGRPGASCFYMNTGIDAGPIIRTREFDPVALPPDVRAAPPEDVAAALLFAYDPHLRARLLVDILRDLDAGADLADLPTTPQDPAEGRTFHYMHAALKARLVRRLQRAGAEGR